MSQPIKDWPESDRQREKLIKKGPEALPKGELLAILQRTGDASTGQRALNPGREIIQEFGESFRQQEGASIPEQCQLKGIGPAKAAKIKATLELSKRFAEKKVKQGERFRSTEDVRVSEESPISSLVHPREVFSPVVRESAAAVTLIYSDLGGPPPSQEDLASFAQVGELSAALGPDHLIIGKGPYIKSVDERYWEA